MDASRLSKLSNLAKTYNQKTARKLNRTTSSPRHKPSPTHAESHRPLPCFLPQTASQRLASNHRVRDSARGGGTSGSVGSYCPLVGPKPRSAKARCCRPFCKSPGRTTGTMMSAKPPAPDFQNVFHAPLIFDLCFPIATRGASETARPQKAFIDSGA